MNKTPENDRVEAFKLAERLMQDLVFEIMTTNNLKVEIDDLKKKLENRDTSFSHLNDDFDALQEKYEKLVFEYQTLRAKIPNFERLLKCYQNLKQNYLIKMNKYEPNSVFIDEWES